MHVILTLCIINERSVMNKKLYILIIILLTSIYVNASRWEPAREEFDYLIINNELIITGQIIKRSKPKIMTWNLSELKYYIYTIKVNKIIKGQVEKKKIKLKVMFTEYFKGDSLLIFMNSQWDKRANGIIEITKKRGQILENFISQYNELVEIIDSTEFKSKRYNWIMDLSSNFYTSDIGIYILRAEKVEKSEIEKLTKTYFSFGKIQNQHKSLLEFLINNSSSELVAYIKKYSDLNKYYLEYSSSENYEEKVVLIDKFIARYNEIQPD